MARSKPPRDETAPRTTAPRTTPNAQPGDVLGSILERLRLLIYFSELTQREIEERVGFSRGHLSQLLGGTSDLKLWHLLAILRVMELAAGDFFGDLFSPHRSPALKTLDDVRRRSKGKPLSFELAQLYAVGIESIADFSDRLERCEEALRELADRGALSPPEETIPPEAT